MADWAKNKDDERMELLHIGSAVKTYAERSPKMVRLVNGTELAELMIDFGMGVSRQRTIVIPKVDLDFFEDWSLHWTYNQLGEQ